ncbi:MAG TPA: bifunctional riboflavin kinase/FAD synthetase [Bdellovibrionales bacterium]|nr:bifunctional riboflavin kinase/FAD synthetase [Bdellovibrionales bacterium]
MQLLNGPPKGQKFHGGSIVMGNFDGLHLGHQSLIDRALLSARPVTVVTFDPHPLQFLKPGLGLKRLFPKEVLEERLREKGIDVFLRLNFDRDLAALPAEEFWRVYVVEAFKPRAFVAGHDFGFGQGRSGNLAALKAWCARDGVELHVCPALEVDGAPVSSRRIREAVEKGDVALAGRLLGRPFFIRGEVIRGAGRGRGLGAPTLNLRAENETVPAMGVYATWAIWRGQRIRSVTNVGVNPTFGDATALKIETHVLDRAVEARGESVDVEFVRRLRPEMKFNSIEDLKKQIQSDILKAHEALDLAQLHT